LEYQRWLTTHKPFHWFVVFYGIMSNGGFDVIIGNPPYVSYSSVKDKYTIINGLYKAESCANLYCYFLERGFNLHNKNGRLGMIVPISIISCESYKPITELSFSNESWVTSFSNRPGKLFSGVEQRLTILLRSSNIGNIMTAKYHHWYQKERDTLFSLIYYSESEIANSRCMLYKIGNTMELSILQKILAKEDSLNSYISDGKFGCWYHDGPTYWIRALSFEPNIGIKSARSNHYHVLCVRELKYAFLISAIMNSTLFYFFFKAISNCRDFGNKELSEFPIGKLPDKQIDILSMFGRELNQRIQQTAKKCSRKYPSGIIYYYEYYPVNGKDIIDKIDKILAVHYNITQEELDFIINYDIKYRMGLNTT